MEEREIDGGKKQKGASGTSQWTQWAIAGSLCRGPAGLFGSEDQGVVTEQHGRRRAKAHSASGPVFRPGGGAAQAVCPGSATGAGRGGYGGGY